MIETGLGIQDHRVDFCYRLFLGREVDTPLLYVERGALPIDVLLNSVIDCAEFALAVRRPLADAVPGLPDRFAGNPEPALLRWICAEIPLPPDRLRDVRSARSWPQLLGILFAEPSFVAMLAGSPELHEHFRASLANWSITYPVSEDPTDRLPGARDIHIVVPLYRQPHLVPGLFDALIENAEEITHARGTIVLVNDSPDDEGLRAALDEHVPRLAAALGVRTITNEANLGFVGSCNRAMRQAQAEAADVLLLNSDALVTPGAIRELRIVAACDPMISVVSPRSNNATICNSPYPDRFRALPLEEAHAAHLAIQAHLPRLSYVPVAVGFCLLIRYEMIDEFGVFDAVYGAGYNEENDFILRCNQRGYRAVLANHAFVFHIGSVSFQNSPTKPSEREATNRAILLSRYPEYPRSVTRYFDSIAYKAEHRLAGLIPEPSGKPRILFDARNIAPHHNGTFELARHMTARFVALHHQDYDIFIACPHQALTFHGFDRITWLSFCWGREAEMAPFAAVIRLAQPFDIADMAVTLSFAPISCYLMLDTIALDCQQLDTQDLAAVWASMAETSTSIGFISEFSAAQFNRRFAVPERVAQFVALCSTCVEDYGARPDADAPAAGEHILIVGNHYPHKHVQGVLDALCEVAERQPIVVLGTTLAPIPGVTYLDAGELDQSVVDDLYDRASVVLFPSFYEGFGLPIMHALARRKPIVCRDLPASREIRERTRFAANIHLCGSTREMARVATAPIAWQAAGEPRLPEQTWSAAAAMLGDVLRRNLTEFDYPAHLERMRRWHQLRPTPSAEPVRSPYVAPPVDLSPRVAVLAPTGGRAGPSMDEQLSIEVAATRIGGCQDLILDAARRLHLGGTLYLDVRLGGAAGPVVPQDILLWLVGFGFSIVRFSPGSGSVVAVARKVQDWTAPLAITDLTDAMFVEHLYNELLDRAPDAGGGSHYVELLAGGMVREQVVRIFNCSAERQQRVAGLLKMPTQARPAGGRALTLATVTRLEARPVPRLRNFVGRLLFDGAKRRA